MRPAPKTTAMAIAASVIWLASKPRHQALIGESGFAWENWKSDWLNHNPMLALSAIQVGASSEDVRRADQREVAVTPTWGDATASTSPAGSLTPRQ